MERRHPCLHNRGGVVVIGGIKINPNYTNIYKVRDKFKISVSWEGIEVPDSDGTRVEFDYQGKQYNVEMSVQMTYSSLGKYSALLKE